MIYHYIKSTDILPGDLIAFSIKADEDIYSKVKYMLVEELVEDEYDDGSSCVCCLGLVIGQPDDDKTSYKPSTTRKQKFRVRDVPTILLLKREGSPRKEQYV